MERPKVRFSKTPLNEKQKKEVSSAKASKVQIQSIEKVNFDIDYNNAQKKFTIRNKVNLPSTLSNNNLSKKSTSSNNKLQQFIASNRKLTNGYSNLIESSSKSVSISSLDSNYETADKHKTSSNNKENIDSESNQFHQKNVDDTQIDNITRDLEMLDTNDSEKLPSLTSENNNFDFLKPNSVNISENNNKKSSNLSTNSQQLIEKDKNIPVVDCFDSDDDIKILKVLPKGRRSEPMAKKISDDKKKKRLSLVSNTSLKNSSELEAAKLPQNSIMSNSKKTASCSSLSTNSSENKSFPQKHKANNHVPQNFTVNKFVSLKTNKDSSNKDFPEKLIKKSMQLMPCARSKFLPKTKRTDYTSIFPKMPATTSKKTVVHNVANPLPKVSVLPSTSDNSCLRNFDYRDLNQEAKAIESQNLLSRPEYNSTISAIKKMNEIKNEKFVKNIEDLPPKCKSMINEKVSAALEFSPNEHIYKDLISLSIDESKLPSVPKRSKDPQPRPKDVIPKLSDFYEARQIEPYFFIPTQICPVPNPVNSSSTFKIQNRVHAWKAERDFDM